MVDQLTFQVTLQTTTFQGTVFDVSDPFTLDELFDDLNEDWAKYFGVLSKFEERMDLERQFGWEIFDDVDEFLEIHFHELKFLLENRDFQNRLDQMGAFDIIQTTYRHVRYDDEEENLDNSKLVYFTMTTRVVE